MWKLPSVLECKGSHNQGQYKENKTKNGTNHLLLDKHNSKSIDNGQYKENPRKN